VTTPPPRLLPLKWLRLDEAFQQRADGLDAATLARMREAGVARILRDHPIPVFCDGETYWAPGGFHRLFLAEEAGMEEVPCAVHKGDWLDAFTYSLGENAEHGLPRSPGDLKKAIRAALAMNRERRAGWSNRDVARYCRCSHTWVNRVAQEEERPPGVETVSTSGGGSGGDAPEPPRALPPVPPPDLGLAEEDGVALGEEARETQARLGRETRRRAVMPAPDPLRPHREAAAEHLAGLVKALAALDLLGRHRAALEAVRGDVWPGGK
jgi:hypothetical protein